MGDKLRKFVDTSFWVTQGISLTSIAHDLTTQEIVREKVVAGEIVLGPIAHFLNEHFVGDVGNAYAAIFLIPVICEFINKEILNNENISALVKDISRLVTTVSPYLMAALFLGVAYNVEMSTNILGAGTGDKLDYVGAAWGVMTALPAVVKFNNRVFHSS